jgi:hypothetical protein
MRTIISLVVGFVLGAATVAIPQSGWLPSLPATAPYVQWSSPPVREGPKSLIFMGSGSTEVLRISDTGEVRYQGRLLGTDQEVWWGLRAAMSPGEWCARWEASWPGGKP